MELPPIFLSPKTPSELLTSIVSFYRYPTTLVIGCSNQDFVQTLMLDVTQTSAPSATQEDADPERRQPAEEHPDPHPLLRAPLMQVVVSRHIRTVFVPTVTHLRAFLATFSVADSTVPAPPLAPSQSRHPPMLLVYGFLEIHRGASEWSAQGLSISMSALVSAVAGGSLRAAIVEPKGANGYEYAEQFLNEPVPILTGSSVRDDGTWRGRVAPSRRVFDLFGFTNSDEGFGERLDTSHSTSTVPAT
ncbi:hypothetical protein HJFPF1_06212 [Paramyrothecium foliicola]|nr:hypothetical protein HJFPF1_06212 [Paramyrothecium foliicola]